VAKAVLTVPVVGQREVLENGTVPAVGDTVVMEKQAEKLGRANDPVPAVVTRGGLKVVTAEQASSTFVLM